MAETIRFNFGASQLLTSERMLRRPRLARLVYSIFGYTNIGNWARANIVVKLFNTLPFHSFKRVLDLGAGLGEFSFMVAQACPDVQVTALEILPERIAALEKAKQNGAFSNVSVFSSKIDSYPEQACFDLIFAVDVFEHIPEKEMPFADCLSKLKPGGYFMVKIPNVRQRTIMPERWFADHHEWLEDEHVGQIYGLKGLAGRFQAEGFTIHHQSYSDGWISRLAWEIGFLSKKGGSFVQLLFIPLCKLLVYMDRAFNRNPSWGNAIQVIGRKPGA